MASGHNHFHASEKSQFTHRHIWTLVVHDVKRCCWKYIFPCNIVNFVACGNVFQFHNGASVPGCCEVVLWAGGPASWARRRVDRISASVTSFITSHWTAAGASLWLRGSETEPFCLQFKLAQRCKHVQVMWKLSLFCWLLSSAVSCW